MYVCRTIDECILMMSKNVKYIQIYVRNARTHLDDGKAQFTDFEIELKTNHIAFTLKNSKVRRRYSDFVWLRNRLMKDLMSSDAPSLPGRRLWGRFNKDFIKQRQKKLQEFLFGLVQNNVYLSHKALHLFLQSKLSSEEIDSFLEANQDEEAAETILAEAEVQARLRGYIARDRVASKHDSGFSGEYDDPDFLLDQNHLVNGNNFVDESIEGPTIDNNNILKLNNTVEEDAFLSDGHNADVDSDEDEQNESVSGGEKSIEDTDENELEKELTRLRLSSLPAPLPEPEPGDDQFESSVEISLNYDSSDNISDDDDDVSLKGETTSGFNSRISSQENVRSTPSKRSKRRFSRNSSFRKMFYSNASLPECGEQNGRDRDELKLRRSKSFYEYRTRRRHSTRRQSDILQKEASFSDCKSPVRQSSFNSHTSHTPRKLRRAPSFLSSTERSPVKRKISLNEYIIVGKHSFDFGNDPKEEFNKSSL